MCSLLLSLHVNYTSDFWVRLNYSSCPRSCFANTLAHSFIAFLSAVEITVFHMYVFSLSDFKNHFFLMFSFTKSTAFLPQMLQSPRWCFSLCCGSFSSSICLLLPCFGCLHVNPFLFTNASHRVHTCASPLTHFMQSPTHTTRPFQLFFLLCVDIIYKTDHTR